jgi:cytochrome c oxidase subunit IV
MIGRQQILFFSLIILAILSLPFLSPLNQWFHLVPYKLIYIPQILVFVFAGLVMTEIMKKIFFARATFFKSNTKL